MQPDPIAQAALEHLASSDGVHEAKLEEYLKNRFPELDWADYDCGNIRDFIAVHVPTVLQQRSADLEGITFRVRQTTQVAAADGLQHRRDGIEFRVSRETISAILSPRGPKVWANPETGQVVQFAPWSRFAPPWFELPKITPNELLRIASDYVEQADGGDREVLRTILARREWWDVFKQQLDHWGLLNEFREFRADRAKDFIRNSLSGRPVTFIVDQELVSATTPRYRNYRDDASTPPAPPRILDRRPPPSTDTIADKILRVISNARYRQIPGSDLSLAIRLDFPEFDPTLYGTRNLRHFIERFVSRVVPVGRSGMDYIYRLSDDAAPDAVQPVSERPPDVDHAPVALVPDAIVREVSSEPKAENRKQTQQIAGSSSPAKREDPQQKLRRVAVSAVSKMSDRELRALLLPLGDVLDALDRDKDQDS